VTVLVGGVGQLYQGDLDLGRHVVERLAREPLGSDVLVEDFHYGAVAVAQRLEDVRPHSLVLVGAAERGRAPGTVERRVVEGVERSVSELQESVGNAVTGYVTIDLVVEVAFALGVLPEHTVIVDVEPVLRAPSDRLSEEGERLLDELLALVREELRSLCR
jgi:hydrogenase maturation protease